MHAPRLGSEHEDVPPADRKDASTVTSPAAPSHRHDLRARWAAGETLMGAWSFFDDPTSVQVMAGAGFDVICLDQQHGVVSPSTLAPLLHVVGASETASLVRVPWPRAEYVMRALDLGADAVLVPMVETAEQAREVARACGYGPEGGRSWGNVFAGSRRLTIDPGAEDARVACLVMIETMTGLENLEEIAAVPGIHGIYVGPNDLALSAGLGRVLWNESAELEALVLRIVETTRAAGLVTGVDCMDAAAARRWAEAGAQLLLAANDTGLLRAASDAAAEALAAAKP